MGKVRQTNRSTVRGLLASLTGRTHEDGRYVGRLVYGRAGTKSAAVGGKVINTSVCRLEGCGGCRLHVLWPDGRRTYPCAAACDPRPDGNLEIR